VVGEGKGNHKPTILHGEGRRAYGKSTAREKPRYRGGVAGASPLIKAWTS
jgi:hypothetical protein